VQLSENGIENVVLSNIVLLKPLKQSIIGQFLILRISPTSIESLRLFTYAPLILEMAIRGIVDLGKRGVFKVSGGIDIW